MKKIEWKQILIPVLIIIFGAVLLAYRLGEQYMWSDEIFSFEAAKMILEKGKPLYDSGLYYGRSSLYHRLLAWSMQNFGINEFGSAIINLPFLIGTALILYFVQGKKNWKLGLTTSLLYLTTNFTIALSRETRMYAMAQFLFFALVICIYRVSKVIEEYIEKRNEIRELINFKNIFLTSITGVIGYLAYFTQPISGILVISTILYFIILSILKKNWRYLIFSLLGIVTLFGGIYLRYETLNIFEWFKTLSPTWADRIVPTYYIVITVRNIPWVLLSVIPVLYLVFKKKLLSYTYLLITLLTFLIFFSLQAAQHERYWQLMIPVIILLAITSIWSFISNLSGRLKLVLLIGSILLISIPHGILAVKELREIDTYTRTSIYQYKKFQFNEVFEYLDQNLEEKQTLIGDYHSVMTLISEGYDVEYVLVLENRIEKEDKDYEVYFNTPYLVYSGKNMEELENVILVVRDFERFEGIEEYVDRVEGFEKPRVYVR